MTTFVDGVEFLEQTPDVVIGRGDERRYGPRYPAEQYKGERGNKFGIELLTKGCNFAVRVSNDALGVDFCYTDPNNPADNGLRWELHPTEKTPDGASIYTGFIEGLKEGDLYTLRVLRDNPHSYERSLLDPYARAITRLGFPDHPDSPSFCVVTQEAPLTSPRPERPKIQPKDRIIYEAHVVDSTMLNTEIPGELRGTCLGVAQPANIEKLKELGVTSLELLPIMQFYSEAGLAEAGRKNHWGYNTAGFFAPHEDYAFDKEPGKVVEEVKTMIDALHEAGIEVILDVVYNHTADGGPSEPTVSLRGLDNEAYYYPTYIDPQDGIKKYFGHTGVGNTVNTSGSAALQLTLDSLRYWYKEMRVDGFRFDLAASLVRNNDCQIDMENSAFLAAIKADETLAGCLFITEPWDCGGYPAGEFAKRGLMEWNGQGRDIYRGFFINHEADLGALAWVLAGGFKGLEDLSVNFITAHDGYTARDLTEYELKHNEANGEDNRDGTNDNRSNNHGIEGPTDDQEIIRRRQRTNRNLFAALLLSRGVPMILDGDPTLHTQKGNNNSYCENPDVTWRSHNLRPDQEAMRQFVTELITIRKQSSNGDPKAAMGELDSSPTGERGLDWFNSWGKRMAGHEYHDPELQVIGKYDSGIAGNEPSDTLLTYYNGNREGRWNSDVEVTLPQELGAQGDYVMIANTDTGEINLDGVRLTEGKFVLKAMSAVVLRKISSRLPDIDTATFPTIELPSLGLSLSDLIAGQTKTSEPQSTPQDAEQLLVAA